jgi:hypothetical protein
MPPGGLAVGIAWVSGPAPNDADFPMQPGLPDDPHPPDARSDGAMGGQRPAPLAMAAMAAVVPVLPGGLPAQYLADLLSNHVLIAGFIAWFCAQFLKVRGHGGVCWGGPQAATGRRGGGE